MKTIFTFVLVALFVIGFGLVGNAIAQPDPGSAAVGDAGPAAAESKDASIAKADVPSESPEAAGGENPAAEGEAAEAKEEEAEKKEPTAGEAASGFWTAIKSREWGAAVGFGLMLIVLLLRSTLLRKIKWVQSKMGGVIVAASAAVLTVGGMALIEGGFGALNFELLGAALTAMASAAGIWGWTKDAKEKLAS